MGFWAKLSFDIFTDAFQMKKIFFFLQLEIISGSSQFYQQNLTHLISPSFF